MIDYFKIACETAESGMRAGEGGPFGAVVVNRGKVIGVGCNQVLSHHDSTAHAEIMAIRQAEEALSTHDLSGCEIYTTCFPCPMCLGAILWARISLVHYGSTMREAADAGFDDQVFYGAFKNPENNSLVTLEHRDNPACRTLLDKWQALPGKRLY